MSFNALIKAESLEGEETRPGTENRNLKQDKPLSPKEIDDMVKKGGITAIGTMENTADP